MHGSLGHFKATLQRRKERKEKNSGKFGKKGFDSNSLIQKTEYKFPELRDGQMERLKGEIRAKLKKESRKKSLILVLIILTLFTLFYFIIQ